MDSRIQCFALFAEPSTSVVDGKPRFGGVAYSGGVVPNYGWAGDMAIDLSSLQAPTEVAILRNHDPNQIVGRAKVSCDGSQLTLSDGSFSDVTAAGKEVAGLMAEGQPWALSVGVNAKAQFFTPKKKVNCNGQAMDVDCLLENARLLEVSFVPAGADPHAYAAQMSARMGLQPPQKEASDMNELEQARARIAELEAQVTALTTDRTALTTERDGLQAQLAAIATEQRTASIAALFGAEATLTDAQRTAYLAMSADQWAAVEAGVQAVRPKADPSLFQQTATAGRNAEGAPMPIDRSVPAGKEVNPERAQLHAKAIAYQREHKVSFLAAARAVGA